jgi:hypothetical protein
MARGTTLGELVTKLRVSARYDPNPALSLNMVPLMQQTIGETQERLYDEFDWPFLRIRRDKLMAAGQRYYDIPDDLNLERIQQVDIRYGDRWLPVERGITLGQYNHRDSDADAREDPVLRWEVMDTGDGEQIEVWPIPATDGAALRFTGIRKLTPLVEQSDRADLDDMLITLYAAGELLGGAKNPEAQIKFAQGKARKTTLQGRVTKTRNNTFTLGGGGTDSGHCHDRTPRVAYVRNP